MDFILMIPDGSAQTSTLYTVEDCIWTCSLVLLIVMFRCSQWMHFGLHYIVIICYIFSILVIDLIHASIYAPIHIHLFSSRRQSPLTTE